MPGKRIACHSCCHDNPGRRVTFPLNEIRIHCFSTDISSHENRYVHTPYMKDMKKREGYKKKKAMTFTGNRSKSSIGISLR